MYHPFHPNRRRHPAPFLAIAVAAALACSSASGASLYQDGAGARAMSLGGAGATVADDPLSALFDNPAALADLRRPVAQLGADGGLVTGSFSNRANRGADLESFGAIGEFALVVPAGPFRFALGINPDIAARVRGHYTDTPGGADGATSYGYCRNESSIVLLRSGFGTSYQILPNLSVGATVGLLYNRNELHTPYVFQSQPVLRTAKTLLDLDSDGLGWNLQGGLRWRPIKPLSLNVVYTSRSRVETHGRAVGNAGVQLANLGLGAAQREFAYDAQVTNDFPQQVSAGAAWDGFPGWTFTAQFDWLNWSDAFDTLPVRLTRGSNADLNSLVGSRRLNDDTPLDWRDQYVGRFGVERTLGEHWAIRAGYSYGNNPVPDGTLTPLTAAITEHLLSAGVGFHRGHFRVDGAYQWHLPAAGHVGRSGLAAGEYSDSVTAISVHAVNVSASVEF